MFLCFFNYLLDSLLYNSICIRLFEAGNLHSLCLNPIYSHLIKFSLPITKKKETRVYMENKSGQSMHGDSQIFFFGCISTCSVLGM